MKQNAKQALSCISLLFIAFSGWAFEHSTALPLSRGKQYFFTRFNTGYYYTDSNYMDLPPTVSLRQILNLPQNSSPPFFQYMDIGLSLGTTMKDWFSIEMFSTGFWFVQSGDGKNLTFSSLKIKRSGLTVRSPHNIGPYFGVIPELSSSISFSTISANSTTPIIDDGSIHITPSVWLYGIIIDNLYPFIQTGFQFRTSSLSSLLQWRGGTMLKSDIADIGVYIHGFHSILKDQNSFSPNNRYQLFNRVNAGSLRFFSFNPELISFTGWLSWNFPYVTLQISSSVDISGKRHSKGYRFLVELLFETNKKTSRLKSFDFAPTIEIDEKELVPDLNPDEVI